MAGRQKTNHIVVGVNAIRPSSISENIISLHRPSRDYKTEEWKLGYFSVGEDLHTYRKNAVCCLPKGYEDAFLKYGDGSREEGPIYKVRAWGVAFLIRYLDFCDEYLKIRNASARTVQDRASWDIQATHWDLPGHFIIASDDHLFKARAPSGKEYVYDYWCRDDQAIKELKKKNAKGETR